MVWEALSWAGHISCLETALWKICLTQELSAFLFCSIWVFHSTRRNWHNHKNLVCYVHHVLPDVQIAVNGAAWRNIDIMCISRVHCTGRWEDAKGGRNRISGCRMWISWHSPAEIQLWDDAGLGIRILHPSCCAPPKGQYSDGVLFSLTLLWVWKQKLSLMLDNRSLKAGSYWSGFKMYLNQASDKLVTFLTSSFNSLYASIMMALHCTDTHCMERSPSNS